MSQGGVKPMRKLPTSETIFQKTSSNFTVTSYFAVQEKGFGRRSTGCLSETATLLFKLKQCACNLQRQIRSAVPYEWVMIAGCRFKHLHQYLTFPLLCLYLRPHIVIHFNRTAISRLHFISLDKPASSNTPLSLLCVSAFCYL